MFNVGDCVILKNQHSLSNDSYESPDIDMFYVIRNEDNGICLVLYKQKDEFQTLPLPSDMFVLLTPEVYVEHAIEFNRQVNNLRSSTSTLPASVESVQVGFTYPLRNQASSSTSNRI